MYSSEVIAGPLQARLVLHLPKYDGEERESSWILRFWKKGDANPISYVYPDPVELGSTSLTRQPLIMTKIYIDQVVLSKVETPEQQKIQIASRWRACLGADSNRL